MAFSLPFNVERTARVPGLNLQTSKKEVPFVNRERNNLFYLYVSKKSKRKAKRKKEGTGE